MKQTKEQMQEELTKLRQSHADWVSGDETRRKALSKMLGADFKPRNEFGSSYGYTNKERETLTWPEIYFEIGKITVAKTFLDFDGNISELECAVGDLKMDLKNLINPPKI